MKFSVFFTAAFVGVAFPFATVPLHAADAETPSNAFQSTNTGHLSTQDAHFIRDAAQGGMLEVQLGELAKTKGTRQDVKEFGGMMVSDHTQANEELKALARVKGVTLDDQLDSKHSARLEKFSKLDASKFDDAYIEDMVADHKKDTAEFEERAKSTKDAELKAFAVKTGGVINTHLERITAIQKAPRQP